MNSSSSYSSFLILTFFCLPCLVACHRDGLTREQRAARRAAVEAMQDIVDGKYADVVDRIIYSDEMSDGYRSEMADLLADYSHAESRRSGGIVNILAVGDSITGDEALVFLQLQFTDSTAEEISFPLVRQDDKWKIK